MRQDVDAIKQEMEEIAKKVRAHKRTMTKTHTDWAAAGSISLASVATHFRLPFFFCFDFFDFNFVLLVCVRIGFKKSNQKIIKNASEKSIKNRQKKKYTYKKKKNKKKKKKIQKN